MSTEQITFLRHVHVRGEDLAQFTDLKSGRPISLTRQKCEDQLRELQKNGLPYGETQLALDSWPETTEDD